MFWVVPAAVIFAMTVPGWMTFCPVLPSIVLAGTVFAASVYDSRSRPRVLRKYSLRPNGVVSPPPALKLGISSPSSRTMLDGQVLLLPDARRVSDFRFTLYVSLAELLAQFMEPDERSIFG